MYSKKRYGKIREKGKDCDNGRLLRAILIKVEKMEVDIAWIKKFIYGILTILLSLLAKVLLGG